MGEGDLTGRIETGKDVEIWKLAGCFNLTAVKKKYPNKNIE
jgi:hypothetical protein